MTSYPLGTVLATHGGWTAELYRIDPDGTNLWKHIYPDGTTDTWYHYPDLSFVWDGNRNEKLNSNSYSVEQHDLIAA